MNNIKKDFPLLENENITYLDSGATTQKPIQVIKAVEEFYQKYNANPHRGAYSLSVEATEQYENTRTKIAKFINARHREEIIFSKNATESLNLIAYSYGMDNLKKDDEVVISIMEHHSNLVPWQKVTKKTGSKLNYMYINDEFELTDEEIENKITDKTKIVGITHVSNVLGTINNVKEIIKYAHKKGAVVIVDASQSIPHMKIDVQDLDADFVVFSGHKMLAPLGIGVLYGKEKLLNNMNPFLMGGDMIEYVYEQDTTFAPLPNKFEAGTQNVEGVVGLGAAIDYINKVGYDNIEKIEKEIEEQFGRLQDLKEQLVKIDLKKNKTSQDLEDVINRMWEEYELTPNNAEGFVKTTDPAKTQKDVNYLRNQIRDLGSINIDSIKEYQTLKERYDFMCEQRLDLENSMTKLRNVISEMITIMKAQFKEKFKLINKNFAEVFKELFGGGKAELILENEDDVLNCGIDIRVQPPGKKLQNMTLLSGGEKAFTAIAILFAILKINPAPFCVLDEIEAALDDVNVNRYAEYLKKFAKDTQFLVITHRKGTMEAADTVYGITMEENGISKLLSMKLK